MSQQRSCCCGPQQKFELECLHSDKMSHHQSSYARDDVAAYGENRSAGGQENISRFNHTYKKPSFGPTTQLNNYRQGEGSTNIDTVKKSGMGCLLCQGSMIMSFQAKSQQSGGMSAKGGRREAEGNCINYCTPFNGSGYSYKAEERMYVLYLAAKDFWYFERGPAGVPYSSFNFTTELSKLPRFDGTYPFTPNNRLGVRETPTPASNFSCIVSYPHVPAPTDNDGLCHPELTNCTNPWNVTFVSDSENSNGGFQGHIYKARDSNLGCGTENTTVEFGDYKSMDCAVGAGSGNWVCASVESNINVFGLPGASPCGGVYVPGFSSWQMYQMRKTPHLRCTADIISYGNGIRLFPAPGEAIVEGALDSRPKAFSSGFGSMYGTLYKVRMWVKADQHINTGYEYPCTDSSGDRVAYYPYETNKRMQTSLSDGGYRIDEKICSSGPATVLYACSGVPVFSSDVKELFDDSLITTKHVEVLNRYYYGDLNDRDGSNFGDRASEENIKHFECDTLVGSEVESALGDTGKFVAKDWRQDQIQKYNELETEFQSKAAEIIAELGENLPQDDLDALTKYTTVTLPDSFRSHLDPLSGENNELLPVQKTGPEFLSMFIHRVAPKQLGNDEERGTLITEMPHYQGSKFVAGQFSIDAYDPWHPDNSGKWPALGKFRQQTAPVFLQSPDGRADLTGEPTLFPFRYPVRIAYASEYYNQTGQTLSDEMWDEMAPPWERELFEIWYKKNPVYFHAVPGGWMWSGDGVGHQPGRSLDFGVAPPATTDTCRWSNQLKKTGLIRSVHQLQFYDSPRASGRACDGFPNRTRLVFGEAGAFPTRAGQLRNIPFTRFCRDLPEKCQFPGVIRKTTSANPGGCDIDDTDTDGGSLCNLEDAPASALGLPTSCEPTQFGICSNGHGATPHPGALMINCCTTRSFYAGSKAETVLSGQATAAVRFHRPKTISNKSTREEVKSWNQENPSVRVGDPSFYGIRCTERGNCPRGYQCCCPSGCGDDCFCIPLLSECPTSPCSSANRFVSDCCETYGSCCYTDSDGKLSCIDDVTNEECIARTELSGLNGTFNKDTTCSTGPCKTSVTTGACFYTDKLVDHQICRQTTDETCTALSGQFFANQECSEFNDKITTGYETITSQLNNKPTYAGDRSCGRFGFSVNCCTEDTNQETGAITRTCETKCISDCDVGPNGTSRIVDTCTACAELGHCCGGNIDDAGYCTPRITKEDCTGTWGPGEECDEGSCITPLLSQSTAPGGLDDCTCTGLLGYNPYICNPKWSNVAGHYDPAALDFSIPAGCFVKNSEVFVSCVSRHIQVTKMGFRHVVMSSSGHERAQCPNTNGECKTTQVTGCCAESANSSFCHNVSPKCAGFEEGEEEDELTPVHEAYSTDIVTFYPFKVRCQQVQDTAGFWKCQELAEYLFPSEIVDYSAGIAGVSDYRTCNNFRKRPIENPPDRCDPTTEVCVMNQSFVCGQGADIPDSTFRVEYSDNNGPGCSEIEVVYLPDSDYVNQAAFCPNLEANIGARAFSIPFRNDTTVGQEKQHLYAPNYGVGTIPRLHCLSNGFEKPVDEVPHDTPAGNVFHECAEYYNDKILSDLDEYYQEPLPVTELTFTDYGGVGEDVIAENVCANDLDSGGLANYFKDAKAEYVDANFGAEDNPGDFWVKKQFPELGYIRLFGVGCYNFPGTYEGGRPNELSDGTVTSRAGGDFAGTMVMSFKTKEEFERYDKVYGSENLKLKFTTEVQGQPNDFPLGGGSRDYTFVAQPSWNIRGESDFSACAGQEDPGEDCAFVGDELGDDDDNENGGVQACSYGQTGYLNGRGLKHADVLSGTDVNNPDDPQYLDYPIYDPDEPTTVGRWGKVYEFCSFIAPNSVELDPKFGGGSHSDGGADNDSGGQLKPVFILPTDPIPKFSGLRGPLVLLSTEKFTVDLARFDSVIENNSCGACYTESANLATGYCTDSDGNRTIAETEWQCLGLDEPSDELGACCNGGSCSVTTEAECTGEWKGEGTDCSFVSGGGTICGGGIGGGGGIGLPPAGNGNVWTEVAPSGFTKDLCLAPDLGNTPTSNYTWYPSVENITNGGAYGCCQHLITDPDGTADEFTCPEDPEGGAPPPCFPFTPCNTWQTGFDSDPHTNPARTYGAGDCWCDEEG